jgi:hypothetical protein
MKDDADDDGSGCLVLCLCGGGRLTERTDKVVMAWLRVWAVCVICKCLSAVRLCEKRESFAVGTFSTFPLPKITLPCPFLPSRSALSSSPKVCRRLLIPMECRLPPH